VESEYCTSLSGCSLCPAARNKLQPLTSHCVAWVQYVCWTYQLDAFILPVNVDAPDAFYLFPTVSCCASDKQRK